MPRDKDRKRLVRRRMRVTGEPYTVALAQLHTRTVGARKAVRVTWPDGASVYVRFVPGRAALEIQPLTPSRNAPPPPAPATRLRVLTALGFEPSLRPLNTKDGA